MFTLVAPRITKQKTTTFDPERQESRKILEELEAQGLIQGGRVSGGAMAFDVSLEQGRAGRLEPLGEVRAPRRLERLNSGKRRPPSRQQLDEKMRNAEMRRVSWRCLVGWGLLSCESSPGIVEAVC